MTLSYGKPKHRYSLPKPKQPTPKKTYKPYICHNCGRRVSFLNSDNGMCTDCQYCFGEVWILDTESYEWTLEKRGEIPNMEDEVMNDMKEARIGEGYGD